MPMLMSGRQERLTHTSRILFGEPDSSTTPIVENRKRLQVLAIDPESKEAENYKKLLPTSGIDILTVNNQEDAAEVLKENKFDLILMEPWSLPDSVNTFKGMTDTPVIAVSEKSEDVYKIAGLDLGADDYVVKPFNPDELAARIKAVLRRYESPWPSIREPIELPEGVKINFDSRIITKNGELLKLTNKEYLLMNFLSININTPVSLDAIKKRVFQDASSEGNIRAKISFLRKKLGYDSESGAIRKIRRYGYILMTQVVLNEFENSTGPLRLEQLSSNNSD
jgi:DNA-binding response OmpR family regulator